MAEPKQVKKVVCLVYSRVVGYLRPISNWNKGKVAEFNDRKTYSLAKAVNR
jgi:ribonucleoside-triphosphate reductase